MIANGQDDTDLKFGAAIRAARESHGWSQSELARRLQSLGCAFIHPTTVARIESGDRSVRLGEAYAISNLFGQDSPMTMLTPDLVRNLELGRIDRDLAVARGRVAELEARRAELVGDE